MSSQTETSRQTLPTEVKFAKIHTCLPNDLSKPLSVTDTETSNYTESKLKFELIVKPWMQRPH